jgi:hypothetical protein
MWFSQDTMGFLKKVIILYHHFLGILRPLIFCIFSTMSIHYICAKGEVSCKIYKRSNPGSSALSVQSNPWNSTSLPLMAPCEELPSRLRCWFSHHLMCRQARCTPCRIQPPSSLDHLLSCSIKQLASCKGYHDNVAKLTKLFNKKEK